MYNNYTPRDYILAKLVIASVCFILERNRDSTRFISCIDALFVGVISFKGDRLFACFQRLSIRDGTCIDGLRCFIVHVEYFKALLVGLWTRTV